LGDHFYIIVMPNILHFLSPCLELIPKNIRVFLILNGVRSWEEEYIGDHYPDYPAFRLMTFPYSSLSHGAVLNLLISSNESDFGIVDHDLYVFNENVFRELRFGQDECVIGLFELTNRRSGLSFPTTHFMFFNIDLVKRIMLKYRIGAHQYRRIPSHLREQLARLDLGYHNFLKDYLSYFDTFNLILAMAFYEGLSAKVLDLEHGDVHHFGGTSYGTDSLYSIYVNMRLLEMPQHRLLKEKYRSRLSRFSTSREIIRLFPRTSYSFRSMLEVDALMERLSRGYADA